MWTQVWRGVDQDPGEPCGAQHPPRSEALPWPVRWILGWEHGETRLRNARRRSGGTVEFLTVKTRSFLPAEKSQPKSAYFEVHCHSHFSVHDPDCCFHQSLIKSPGVSENKDAPPDGARRLQQEDGRAGALDPGDTDGRTVDRTHRIAPKRGTLDAPNGTPVSSLEGGRFRCSIRRVDRRLDKGVRSGIDALAGPVCGRVGSRTLCRCFGSLV